MKRGITRVDQLPIQSLNSFQMYLFMGVIVKQQTPQFLGYSDFAYDQVEILKEIMAKGLLNYTAEEGFTLSLLGKIYAGKLLNTTIEVKG